MKNLLMLVMLLPLNEISSQIISEKLIEKHLTVLSDDSMEGRKIGTQGIEKAAQYIESEFNRIGLSRFQSLKSYRQGFMYKEIPLANLIGVLKGKSKADEYVVISAHYAHWQTTRTINRDLLNGRQESITADNAIKRGLGSYSRLLSGDSHANSHRHGTARRSLLSGADLYRIEPLGDGGFSVTATREVPEGAVLTISVAYDTDGGNPIKNWQPADFRLDYMTVEIEGGQLVEKSDNKIQARSTGNEGLKVKVQGFDPNCELLIEASLSEDN